MVANPYVQTLLTPHDTSRIAVGLGEILQQGDVVLMTGDVGAGKTHFARALIQSLLEKPEDVPSPTFTLVQTYETIKGEIWHTDLYRLTDISEVEELGLLQAFETAICFIEWPDLLGSLSPSSALSLFLENGEREAERILTVQWTDERWTERLVTWLT